MTSREAKQDLADRLIKGGGDPKQAREFAGVPEPEPKASKPKAASKAKSAASNVASAGRSAQSKMNAGSAQKWIFGIMLAIVGIQLFNDIIQGRNRQFDVIPRRIFAGSLAGIFLMLLAIVTPKIALGLASVMAATTLLVDARASGVFQRLANVARSEGSGSSAGETEVTTGTRNVPTEGSGSSAGETEVTFRSQPTSNVR